jgi:hypothetical protein
VSSTSGSSGANGVSGGSGTSTGSGVSGTSGSSGVNGASGGSGTSTGSGVSGTSGSSGVNGGSGGSGTSTGSGTSGSSGLSGGSGGSGVSGASGTSGSNGVNGASGGSGASGYSGTSPITYLAQNCDGTGYNVYSVTNSVSSPSGLYRWNGSIGGYNNCWYFWCTGGAQTLYSVSLGGECTWGSGYANSILAGRYNNFCYSNAFSVMAGSYNSAMGGTYNTMIAADNTDLHFSGNPTYSYTYGTQVSTIAGGTYRGIMGGAYTTAYSNYYVCFYYLTKLGGSFRIDHPDPVKRDSTWLFHSFVESPTAGDNIYRYTIETKNCCASMELPDYFKFLNCDETMKIAPVDHFGRAFGEIDETQSCVTFTSNCDGKYNVLIFGTRKDPMAVEGWLGVEQPKAHNHAYGLSERGW